MASHCFCWSVPNQWLPWDTRLMGANNTPNPEFVVYKWYITVTLVWVAMLSPSWVELDFLLHLLSKHAGLIYLLMMLESQTFISVKVINHMQLSSDGHLTRMKSLHVSTTFLSFSSKGRSQISPALWRPWWSPADWWSYSRQSHTTTLVQD